MLPFKSTIRLLLFTLGLLISLGLYAQPGNDDCSDAIFICKGYEYKTGTNQGATTEGLDELLCGDMTPQKTVWYKVQCFVPGGGPTGSIDITLSNVEVDGFEIQIFEATGDNCSFLTPLLSGCDIVSGSFGSPGSVTVSFTGTHGTYYYIMVDGKNGIEDPFYIKSEDNSSLVGKASADFSLPGGNNVFCLNNDFEVANNTIEYDVSQNYDYFVDVGDGSGYVPFDGTKVFDTLSYSAIDSYLVTYRVEHNRCLTAYSNPFDVIVQELKVDIDTNNAFCSGFPINFTTYTRLLPDTTELPVVDRYIWTITDACQTYTDTVITDSVNALLRDTLQYTPCGDTLIVQLETYSNTCLPDTVIDTFYLYTVKVEVDDTLICYGNSVQLNSAITNQGIPPYDYTWTPSDSFVDANISNPMSLQLYDTNKYYVNVTDHHGCPATDSITISVNPKLSVDAGPRDTICRGETAILTSAIIDNGSGSISYQWSDPDSIGSNTSATATASPSKTDTFFLQVTDVNLCTANDLVAVQVSDLIIDAGLDTSICLGDSASLRVDTSSSIAISPFTFAWSSGATLDNASTQKPKAGPSDTLKYFVTVTDQHNCFKIDSVIVNVNLLDVSVGIDTLICYEDTAQLNADTTIFPGISPYQFSWNPSASLDFSDIPNPQATPSDTTQYDLVLTDAMGCMAKDTMIVNVNPELSVDAGADTLICYGDTAYIVLDTTLNGTSPLSFLWGPPNGSLNVLDSFEVYPLDTSIYHVEVTDANSCKATDTITVNVNLDFKINIIPDTSSIFVCAGDSFSLSVDTASIPGVPPYTYNWTPGKLLNDSNINNPVAQPTDTILFSVLVTDANNCPTDIDTLQVISNPLLSVYAGADTLIYFGDTANLNAQLLMFGTPPVDSVLWTPGDSLTDSLEFNTFAFPEDTQSYVVRVTDSVGCSASDTVFVNVNPPFSIRIQGDTFLCYGESDTLGIIFDNSGTPPYTYQWSPDSLLISSTIIDSPIVTGLDTITYYVTVTDSNGATSNDSIRINVNPPISVNVSNDSLICYGDTIEIIATVVDSGSLPIIYSWNTLPSISDPSNDTTDAYPTDTTDYIFTVTDSFNCVAFDTVNVMVNPILEITIMSDTLMCYGVGLQIEVDSTNRIGTAPYNYLWSPSVNVSNVSEFRPIISATDTQTYTLSLTDASNCSTSDSISISVYPILYVDITNDTLLCYGEELQIESDTINRIGTPPYRYSWTPNLDISDTTILEPLINTLSSRTYYFSVTDSNNCEGRDTLNLTINNDLQIGINNDTTICYGQSVKIVADTSNRLGTPPYIYQWLPNYNIDDVSIIEPTMTPLINTSYKLTITDSVGCIVEDSFKIYVEPEIALNLKTDTFICYGDTISLDASLLENGYGDDSLIYLWVPAMSIDLDKVLSPNAFPLLSTIYTVIVTDTISQCAITDSILVNVNPQISFSVRADTMICFGDSITIDVDTTAIGGSPPFNFLWQPSAGLSSDTILNPVVDTNASELYILSVTDANNCIVTDSFQLSVTPQLFAVLPNDTFICYQDTIPLTTQITGNGIGTLNHSWSPSGGLSDVSELSPNAYPLDDTTYTFLITDSLCSFSDSVSVLVNNQMFLSIVSNDTLICYGDTFQIRVDTSLVTGPKPLSYIWDISTGLDDTTIAEPFAFPTDTTLYTILVEDTNGCQATDSINIEVSPEMTISLDDDTLICFSDSITLSALMPQNGTGNLTYNWLPDTFMNNNQLLTPTVAPDDSFNYVLVATDISGCAVSDSINVMVNPEFIIDAKPDTFLCYGDTAQLYVDIVQQGTPGYNYIWSPNDSITDNTSSTPMVFPDTTTYYNLTVTDLSQCISIDSVLIKVNPELTIDAGIDTLLCGYDTAQINGSVIGGTSPYSFSWLPFDSLSANNILSPIAYPRDTTTYYLTVTDDSNCVVGPDSVTVNVNPPLNLVLNVSPDSLKNSIWGIGYCSWDSIAFEYTVSGGEPSYNLSWSLGSQNLGGELTTATDSITETAYFSLQNDAILKLDVGDNTGVCTASVSDTINILRPSYSFEPLCNIADPLTSNFVIDSFDVGALFDWSVSPDDNDSLIYGDPSGTYATPDPLADFDVDAHFENVDSGEYFFSVEVNDTAKGCLDTLSFKFVKDSSVVVDLVADSLVCYGDSSTLQIVGDSLDLSYLWINNTTGDTLLQNTRVIKVLDTISTEYAVEVVRHGCSFNDTALVLINPRLDVSAGTDKDICLGDSVMFTPDSTYYGVSPLIFAWLTDSNIIDSTAFLAEVYPIDTFSYILLATDSNGCTSLDTAVVNVTNIQFDIGPDTMICKGDSFQLTLDTSLVAGSPPYLYSWTPSDSLTSDSIYNPIAFGLDSNKYYVTLTDSKGCLNTDSILINVIDFTIDAGLDTTICINDTIVLDIDTSVVPGISPITYLWASHTSLSDSSLYNPDVYPLDSMNYTIKATDSLGCIAHDTIRVNVVDMVVDIGNDTSICLGNGMQFGPDTSSFEGNSPYIYNWTPYVNVDDSSIFNPIVSSSLPDTFTLKLQVTDSLGCIVYDSINVNIIDLTVDAGDDTLMCYGNSVQLFVDTTVVEGMMPYTYSWSSPDSLNDPNIYNPIASNRDTIMYTVTVTDMIGCVATDSVLVDVIDFSIDAGLDTAICINDTIQLDIDTSVVAGISPITYLWASHSSLSNPSIYNPEVYPTDSIDYTIEATDDLGCIAHDTIRVNVVDMVVDIGNDTSICLGNGMQFGPDTSSFEGNSPFIYDWTPYGNVDDSSIFNPIVSSNVPDTFTLKLQVTDSLGCIVYDSININIIDLTVDAGDDTLMCYGNSVQLFIDTTVVEGIMPYTYSWSSPDSLNDPNIYNPIASNRDTITYTVTVTDMIGCVATDFVTIKVNPRLLIDAGTDDFICYEDSTQLSASVDPTNIGLPPYQYQWTGSGLITDYISNDTITDPYVRPLDTTKYIIVVTDANSCTASDSVFINVNPKLQPIIGNDTLICYGDSIYFNPDTMTYSGTHPWVYIWTPNTLTDANIHGAIGFPLDTTTYKLVVFDAMGCSKSDSILVKVNPQITAEAGPDKFICYGDNIILDGDTSISGAGGISIQWLPTIDLDDPFTLQPVADPTSTTTYTIQITDSNACSWIDSMTLTVNPELSVDAGNDTFVCFGESVQLLADTSLHSGTPKLNFSWSPTLGLDMATIHNPLINFNTDSISYVVTVTDANICTAVDSILIMVNPEIRVDAGLDTSVCLGDTAILRGDTSILNGTPPLSIAWSPSNKLDNAFALSPNAFDYTDTIEYYLTATDAMSCSSFDSVTVNVIELNVQVVQDLFICYNDSAQLNVLTDSLNGDASYNYTWTPAADLNNANISSPEAKPLSTTLYKVSVTDNNGCFGMDSMTLDVNPELTIDAGQAQFICLGDTTQLVSDTTSRPGTPPLSFEWSPSISIIDSSVYDPFVYPSATTSFIVSVTDSKLCTANDNVLITVTELIVSAGADQFICFGDSIQLFVDTTVSTGNPPMTYQWTDVSASLNNTSVYDPVASPTDTSLYVISVTDASNCLSVDSIFVNVSKLSVSAGIDKFICFGDSVMLNVDTASFPGNPPYTYNWSPPTGLSQLNIYNPIAMHTDTVEYMVKVIDATNCTVFDTITVNVNPQFSVSVQDSQFICYGDSFQLSVDTLIQPTYSPYSFSWSPTDSVSISTVHDPYVYPRDTTVYSVLVTDANNCTASDSILIKINPNLNIDLSSNTNFLCYGDTVFLSAILTDSGTAGVPLSHVYEWFPTDSISDTSILNPYATPTFDMIYSVRVRDGLLCENISSVNIKVNPEFTIDAGLPDTVCAWESVQLNASVIDSGTLGVPSPYGFLWTPSMDLNNALVQSPVANTDTTTMYYVIATDSNFCTATDSVEIKVSPPIIVTLGNDTLICYKDSFRLNASISSGIPPYTFSWEPAQILSDSTILDPLTTLLDTVIFILNVEDSNQCTRSDTQNVMVNPAFSIDAYADTNFLCYGESTFLYADTLNNQGGTPPYTILWTPSDSLSSTDSVFVMADPRDSIIYTVSFTDSSSCVQSKTVSLGVNPLLEVVLTADTGFICHGDSLDLNVQLAGAGTPGIPTSHLYLWEPVDSISDTTILSPFANPTISTDYKMTIVDGNYCTYTDSISILVNPKLSVDVGNDTMICKGNSLILNANVTDQGTPGAPASHSYEWSNAVYLNNPYVATPLATPDTTTVFAVTITDAKLCTAGDSITVNVHELLASAGTQDTLCQSGSIILNGSGNGSMYWTDNGFNGQFLPNSSDPKATYIPHPDSVGAQPLSLVVVDTLGLCNYIIDTIQIEIEPYPRGGGLVYSDTICSYDTVTIGGSLTYINSVSWSDNGQGGQFILSNNTLNNKYVPASTQASTICLTLIGYGAAQCAPDTSSACFNVLESPYVTLDSLYKFCKGDTIAFNPIFNNAINPAWSDNVGGQFLGLGTSSLYVNSDTVGGHTVYVLTESDTFCPSHLDSTNIFIDTLPEVSVSHLNAALCYTDTVSLGATGAEIYHWTSDDLNWSDSLPDSVSTITTYFTGTTNYQIIGVDSNGCRDTVLFEVETKENISPEVTTDYDLMNCYPVDIYFDLNQNLPAGINITDINWTFGDGSNSNELAPMHTFERSPDSTYPAKYQIAMNLTYSNACENGDTIYVDVCEQFVLPNVFTPNGDGQNDIFEIPGYYKLGGPCQFVIHDRWGNIIYQSLNYTNDWDGTGVGGITATPGLYYYTLGCSDNNSWTGWIRLIR